MTQEIKLTRGFVALVDDLDFSWLNQYKWNTEIHPNVMYAKTGITNTRMHVLIMQPKPGFLVHHLNGNGLDNTRDNLEIIVKSQHTRLSPKIQGETGYRGVYKSRDRFRAMLWIDGKNHSIGTFNTAKEAAQAWNEAAEKILGRGNFLMNNLE